MTGLLAAVTALQRLDEAGVRALLDERALPYERITDYFDLAEQLLSPARLNTVLPQQQRAVLEVLRGTHEHSADAAAAAHAETLLLLDPESGAPYPPVRSWLEAHPVADEADAGDAGAPAGIPGATAGPGAARENGTAPETGAASAMSSRFSERGYRAITAAADLAAHLAGHGARRRELAGIGNISAVDARRIGEVLGLEPEQAALLLALADRAGLLTVRGGSWRPDTAGEDEYRRLTPAERWWRLATAWSRLLVHPVLPPEATPPALGTGEDWAVQLQRFLAREYPLGSEWVDPLLAELLGGAELLGITENGRLTEAGAAAIAVLSESSAAAATAAVSSVADGAGDAAAPSLPEQLRERLGQLLPQEVEHVYVQHDLSVIAPGPLRADLDARLRAIAGTEGQGFASGYRITADSLARGFAEGLDEERIRSFLEQVSLTGIPQPLDYLLRELGVKHGSIRVTALTTADAAATGFRSRLRAADAALLDELLVDSRLRLLQFTRVDDELHSAVNASVVVLTLQEARYPAVIDTAPSPHSADAAAAAALPAAPSVPDELELLLARLAKAREQSPQSRQSWFTRQLQSAIRAKLPVTITVLMPDDTTADFELDPSAVAGGRVRGRDRRSDSEHTLPLSRVQEIVIRQD